MAVTRVETRASHLYGSDDALVAYIAQQTRRRERLATNPDAMIKTGIPSLDNVLGDISPGTLHAIVARSSVGKTIYMEMVAEHNAKRGHRVAFYHLELPHEMMMDRLMARHAKVSVNELRRGYGGRELSEAMQLVRGWYRNLVYIHCPGWGAERIAADIQRLVAREECEVAIVDYLQKITLPSGGSTRGLSGAMLYGLVAEFLKNVAEIAGIPVVIGSQVSRDYKTRVDQRPHMEDIRNSGEIEE
jgi:replicative DNA helicase